MTERVGIIGVPPLDTIRLLSDEGAEVVDLDAAAPDLNVELEARLIPRYYCAILRTVLSNALRLKLDRIYADVGRGKCDGARYVTDVLRHELSIPIVETQNADTLRRGNPVCVSALPLVEKFERIVESVKSPEGTSGGLRPSTASCAFWGVPPRDFGLLELFPADTHVFGWTRCMENKTPADTSLELEFDPALPTVFFAQSFCAKNSIAYYMAHLHPRGFYVDGDFDISSSTRAKVEAFLELNGVRRG